jgi:hypothetical protein
MSDLGGTLWRSIVTCPKNICSSSFSLRSVTRWFPEICDGHEPRKSAGKQCRAKTFGAWDMLTLWHLHVFEGKGMGHVDAHFQWELVANPLKGCWLGSAHGIFWKYEEKTMIWWGTCAKVWEVSSLVSAKLHSLASCRSRTTFYIILQDVQIMLWSTSNYPFWPLWTVADPGYPNWPSPGGERCESHAPRRCWTMLGFWCSPWSWPPKCWPHSIRVAWR